MKFNEFFNECREKGVFKNLSIYVVSSWVLLQVISLLAQPLNLPASSLTVLLLLLLLGFPLYALFLWQYRIQPENRSTRAEAQKQYDLSQASAKSGVKIDPMHDVSSLKATHKKFQKMYFGGVIVLGVLAVLAAIPIIRSNFYTDKPVMVPPALISETVSDKIAVLQFDNNTGNTEFDIVGKMAVDWIMHGITKNKVGQVISPKIIEDYSKVLKASMVPTTDNNAIAKYLKPSKVVNGSFYEKDAQLLFQSAIMDKDMSETLAAFGPISCDKSSPLDCIEELKQRILGFLVTEETPLENLQDAPPKYEAYRYLMEAKSRYGSDEDYIALVEKAIAADSTFFEAKMGRMEFYYNQGEYALADSLINVLSMETIGNDRQTNLLRMYGSLLAGNNGKTYEYLRNEYSIYPFDLETNTSTMTVALQFVNRPEDVDAVFNVIPSGEMDLENCQQCSFRYRVKGLSDIELGKYDEVIALLKPFEKTRGDQFIKEVILRAKIRAGNLDEEVRSLLGNFKLTASPLDWQELSVFAGKEYAFIGNDSLTNAYLDPVVSELRRPILQLNDDELQLLGYAYLYKKDYQEAEKYWERYFEIEPLNRRVEFLGLLAICYYKNGKQQQAELMLERLEDRRKTYMYGHVDYALARYFAAIGQQETSLEHLMKAIADGKWFETDSYQNDVFLQPLGTSEAFEGVLKYWN